MPPGQVGRSWSRFATAASLKPSQRVFRLASILEGTDRATRRPVMIKAFAKAGMSPLKREKIDREVAILKATSECSGVVRMLNVVEDQNHHYTVLEAVPGIFIHSPTANRS